MLGTINSNNNRKPFNSSWQLTRASVDSLAHAIEGGQQDALASYLGVMARFYTYSARNVLLIAAQRPDATHIEGVRSWNELGRFVRPGEKGIFIFAPAIAIKNQPQQENGNGNGKKSKGKKSPEPAQQERHLLGFRGVWVFDISQTGGDEQPESRKAVDTNEALPKLASFAENQSMSLEYADWLGSKKASSYRGTIRLLPNMEPNEAFPLLLHEVASQLLYAIQRRTFVTKAMHQQESKAVCYVVAKALGLDNAAFADCQLYYGDSRLLGESLEVVHRTAARILGTLTPEGSAQFTQGVN